MKKNNKISVLMPSYLGSYIGSATDRDAKFNRAIDSFLSNLYPCKELIIVSDGCEKTIELYKKKYSLYSEIKLIEIPKQPTFSGNVRQEALRHATGEIICYLDSDDMFGEYHLYHLNDNFDPSKHDWVYFNDHIKYFHFDHIDPTEREVLLESGLIGTSSIAHKNDELISWIGCNGYGHDWTFVERLIKFYPHYTKIKKCSYIVCHIPNSIDH